MGMLRSAVKAVARASAGPLSGIATPEKWVVDWFTGDMANSAGVRVDYDTAMMYAPFFAGVRVISEDLGSLPLFLYERLARGKQRATGHPLYSLLHDAPNDMMGAMAFKEALQGHAITWGGGAAYVVTDERTGVIEELWPLRPDRLRVKVRHRGPGRAERWFQYVDDVNGIYANLAPGEVLYVNGLGFDGLRGYSVVELAANSIGLGLATEHYGAKTFSNGAAPAGALSHPENLSPEARKRMADDWENIHRGIDRAHRVAILEEGVTWQAVGLPNDANQFLETRKLQVTDMARWLRLPPHKIGDLDRATFSNIEQQQLDYVSSALNSWLVRWEQAILTQLLLPEERARFFPEHLVDALLRGDTVNRYQAYAVGRQWGWLSANDVRERENMNPVDGGDAYLVPLNMVPASGGPATDDEERAAARRHARLLRGRSIAARERIAAAWAGKIEEADQEIADLEREKVDELVDEHLDTGRGRRSTSAFIAALQSLYAEDGPIAQAMSALWLPIMTAFAADVAEDAADEVGHDEDIDLSTWSHAYTLAHIGYRIASGFGQLRKQTETADTQEDAATAIVDRLIKWQQERPEQTARWEATQMSNAAAREAWKESGVRQLKWVTQGSKNCPYCTKLDGRTVSIEDPFIAKGDEVDGEDGEKLVAKRDTKHPPVHPGCNCQVVPVT
ncbi:phage portal protein [Streptomyces sp. STCH 565 A]|uniref:phage portal protein n=1 Tax=Streptomyces sp. STCH 565 A TaxID=2950532 RepID=UPI0020752A0E|nr:phage portal protein [Streptomyces sp. STCH 565 A]MCM8550058.1 phage portal protein [Streptomyces sp. STCH 565 A]